MDKKSDRTTGVICAVGCEIVFGLSYAFTKQASGHVPALLGWRFLLAFSAISIAAGTGIIRISLRGKHIRRVLPLLLFNPCIYFIAEAAGILNTTVSESGIILASLPVASLSASAVILKKKPSKIQTAGIFVTFSGVISTVLSADARTGGSALGYAALIAAVISYALYCVLTEMETEYTGTELTFLMIAAGAAFFTVLATAEAISENALKELVFLPFREPQFAYAVLYQGLLCSIGAFFMSNTAISKIGVNRTSSFTGISTVASILSGVLIFRERVSLQQLLGVAMILSGILIANSRRSLEKERLVK